MKAFDPGPVDGRLTKRCPTLIQYPRMRHIYRLILLGAGGSLLLLTGCATGNVATGGGSYHVTAYKPHDPSKVKVKLSTSTQNLFVMEGDRVLMAVQANVGKPGRPNPAWPLHDLQQTKRAPTAERAGPRLPDGVLVRVRAGLWISRRICLAGAAYPWLRSSPSRSGCSTLRPGPDRHAGGDRKLAARGSEIWQSSSPARSKPRPGPAAFANDVPQLV